MGKPKKKHKKAKQLPLSKKSRFFKRQETLQLKLAYPILRH